MHREGYHQAIHTCNLHYYPNHKCRLWIHNAGLIAAADIHYEHQETVYRPCHRSPMPTAREYAVRRAAYRGVDN